MKDKRVVRPKHKKLFGGGFSLIEIVVAVTIIAIMAALLFPSLITHVEQTRAQKDSTALNEVSHSIEIGLSNLESYEELLKYSVDNNVSCYVDKNAESSYKKVALKTAEDGTILQYTFGSEARTMSEVPYHLGGTMYGLTITFEPDRNANEPTFKLANGIINKFTPSGGQKLSDSEYLYDMIRQICGDQIELASQMYRNSEFTIFIHVNLDESGQIDSNDATVVYGQWSGTNLMASDESYEVADGRVVYQPSTGNEGDGGEGDGEGTKPTDPTDPTDPIIYSCTHKNTETRNAVSATCTTPGHTGMLVCTDCGLVVDSGEEIDKLNHDTIVENKKEATCIKAGYSGDKVCVMCGQVIEYGAEVPSGGHSYTGAYTSLNDKTHYRVCANGCGTRETVEHELTTTTTKKATCIEVGPAVIKCNGCDYTTTKTIPLTDHAFEMRNVKDATCGSDGYTGDKVCSVCGITSHYGTTTKATGKHTYEVSSTVAASCTEDGHKVFDCKRI